MDGCCRFGPDRLSMRLSFVVRLSGSVVFLVLAFDAVGCSCASWPEGPEEATREAYKTYSTIFLGTAKSVKMLPGEGEIQETEFTIHKVWKGEVGSTITTRISVMCCICGYAFERDITYLVFAFERDDGNYGVSICSLTRRKERATDYIQALDRISKTH